MSSCMSESALVAVSFILNVILHVCVSLVAVKAFILIMSACKSASCLVAVSFVGVNKLTEQR